MTNSAPLDLSVSTTDKDISCFIGHKTMQCPIIICLYDLRLAEYATKSRYDVWFSKVAFYCNEIYCMVSLSFLL